MARRRERAQRDRRLEKLAIEVLTATGEREATIAATEQRAGAALQAMITDESLTVSEAVQRCAGAISHREAARLRQLAAQAHNNKPENDSMRAADIRVWGSQILQAHVEFWDSCLHKTLMRERQAEAGG